jgi:ATP-dependent Clp protease adaptor protein ClpS
MAVDTEELARNVTRLLPPYRVLLHNDDHNTMDHVVRALVESVPQLSVREAGRIMLEAHLRGVAQVIVCPKEQAELYCERLTCFGLTATLEPAG